MDKAAQRSIGIPIKHTGLDGKLVETILGRLHPRKVSPPTPKLILSQTPTLTIGVNLPRGQSSGCPLILKLTLPLTQIPTLTVG